MSHDNIIHIGLALACTLNSFALVMLVRVKRQKLSVRSALGVYTTFGPNQLRRMAGLPEWDGEQE